MADTEPDCLFCGIVNETIPASIVYTNDDVVAFMDINPASYGHLLVIPRRHSRDITTVSPEDLTATALAAQELAKHAVAVFEADGVNLLNCCGESAWQSVFHFHLHVIPRYADGPHRDKLVLPWESHSGDPDDIASAAGSLKGD